MPHTHHKNQQQAATHLIEVTREPPQYRLHSPVRRSTVVAYHTELPCSTNNSPTPITTTRNMYYKFPIDMKKRKIHQQGEHSRNQPDPTGSLTHGRSLHTSFNAAQSVTHQHYTKLLQFYNLILRHGEFRMTTASTERPSELQVRLQYAVRRNTMRRKLSATRLAAAKSAFNHATRRKYIRIYFRFEKMPDTYSSSETTKRPQSDLKIAAMLNHDTDSATSSYGQIPLSPAHRYIMTKQGRSTNGRLKYYRAKQIRGLLNPRINRGYLQVPRAYLQPYPQVPTGTHNDTPAGGTHFSHKITNDYAAPEAAETYTISSSDPCPTRKRTRSTHLPRMGAPEGSRHSRYIKRTRIYPQPEPCHPLVRRRRAPFTTTPSHKIPRHCLHVVNDIQCGNEA